MPGFSKKMLAEMGNFVYNIHKGTRSPRGPCASVRMPPLSEAAGIACEKPLV